MKRHIHISLSIRTMDGVVVVERRSGSLHFTRSFTKRFERRHPVSERMNLGALFFALQNFASNSFHEGQGTDEQDAHIPAIGLLETAAERIVLAQSVSHQLLIVLFVRRTMDADVAKSVVQRIAFHYDYDLSLEMRLATVLSQGGKLFREACEKAIQGEVDSLLQSFVDDQGVDVSNDGSEKPPSGFILFHYAPSVNYRRLRTATRDGGGDNNDDEDSDDYLDNISSTSPKTAHPDRGKESLLLPPSAPSSHAAVEPPQRLQKLFASTRSLLGQPAAGHHKRNVKKNAVMNHAEPRAFQSLRRLPSLARGGDESLAKILDHPQFAQALVDALQPSLKAIAALILIKDSPSMVRTLKDATWRRFPLPRLSVETSDAKPTAADLRLWKRDGCLLVYTDHRLSQDPGSRARVASLFDKLEPLARCALNISS